MDLPETQALKVALRRDATARRQMASIAEPHAGHALTKHFRDAIALPAGIAVSGYWPLEGEMDIRPLLHHLHGTQHRVGLPVVVGKAKPLVFREWHPGMKLVVGSYKVETPPTHAPELVPDLLLVPLLAFDTDGYRLGYGGGFYDRTLTKLRETSPRRPIAVGVAYAAQQMPAVPRGPFDQPLDWIVTERWAHRFTSGDQKVIR